MKQHQPLTPLTEMQIWCSPIRTKIHTRILATLPAPPLSPLPAEGKASQGYHHTWDQQHRKACSCNYLHNQPRNSRKHLRKSCNLRHIHHNHLQNLGGRGTMIGIKPQYQKLGACTEPWNNHTYINRRLVVHKDWSNEVPQIAVTYSGWPIWPL